MATITVLDSTGATQTVAKVTATGSTSDANSLPVAQSTEDKAVAAAANALLATIDADTGSAALALGAVADAAVINPASSASVIAALKGLLTQIAATNTQLPASLGSKSVAASMATSVKSGGNEYETVAASQTAQVLGATGATGDYIEGVLCVVSTAATSQVILLDNATSITILPDAVGAGVGSYYVPLGLTSVSGAWKITTAAGVAVVATGDFT